MEQLKPDYDKQIAAMICQQKQLTIALYSNMANNCSCKNCTNNRQILRKGLKALNEGLLKISENVNISELTQILS